MLTKVARGWTLALLVCAGASHLAAQGFSRIGGFLNPVSPEPSGLRLYSLSGNASYYSSGIPVGFGAVGYGPLDWDVALGGGASIGWSETKDRSSFSITYSPSYLRHVRYTNWSALNHELSILGTRKLGRKWSASFALTGSVATADLFMFAPTQATSLASIPTTFDAFAAATLQGQYSSSQLASALTGSPGVDSPLRMLLYGDRSFVSTATGSFSYQHSSRLTVAFGVSGSRYQHLSDTGLSTAQYQYFLPTTTSGGANISIQYSATPRTQIGGSVMTQRVISSVEDAYISAATLNLGHTIGRRWVAQVSGGGGLITPVRQTYAMARGFQYTAGASLAYKLYAHTFVASANRAIGDTYGFGATSTVSTTGAWHWQRPGSSWSTDVSGSWQKMRTLGSINAKSWQASGGISRALSQHVFLRLQYTYLDFVNGYVGYIPEMAESAAQISVIWSPYSRPR